MTDNPGTDDGLLHARILRLIWQCPKCNMVKIDNPEKMRSYWVRCNFCECRWAVGVVFREWPAGTHNKLPLDTVMLASPAEPHKTGRPVNDYVREG